MTTLALRHVRARRRAGFFPVLGALTFALVLASAASAPVGNAAFPGVNGKIAFWSTRDGNAEIYAMSADGSGVTGLTNNSASDGDPAWSPDGTRIAFHSDRDGGALEIYVMSADGAGQTRLTTNSASDFQPAWSPDGTKIAFVSDRDGAQPGVNCITIGNCEIYVMNADGSGVTRCTNNPAAEFSPAWSPDGTMIAFDRANDIWVMNGCGGVETQLTSGAAIEGEPNWAPDGTKIAFVGRASFSNAEIFVIDANGSNMQQLTNTANFITDSEPAWSPDGTKIAFPSDRDVPGINEIYVMNADGSGVTRLTTNAAADQAPDWQPLCNVIGTEGNDFRIGGGGDDLMCGFGGHDALLGLGGNDRIFGHAGSDGIAGGSGNDRIVGGEAPDALFGGSGNDTIHAADGSKDFVSCGPGIDQVTADPTDVLTGCEVVTFG